MTHRTMIAAAFIGLFASTTAVQAEDLFYSFKPGESVTYEIDVRTEFPDGAKTTIGYLILRPQSIDDAKGQTTLTYAWGIRYHKRATPRGIETSSIGSLAPMFQGPGMGENLRQIIIDPRGTIVRDDGASDDAQLDSAQGPAWRLPLEPLPPAGQQTWTTHRQLQLYTEEKTKGPGGFPMSSGSTKRVITPSDETVTYTADKPVGSMVTVHRKYELVSAEKVGDTPADRLHGDGQYIYDNNFGRIVKIEWNLTDEIVMQNVTFRLPISVTAHMLTPEELTALKTELDAQQANINHHLYGTRTDDKNMVRDINQLPDGMEQTEILGDTRGGKFVAASSDRRPVIGFRIRTSDFMGRRCFAVFDPLYEKPKTPDDPSIIILLARDGYAVGSITVNATEFFNACCVTFMKKTDTGLDPKTSYISQWYGRKIGTAQKKLGGKGQFVYGVCGTKGMNVDGIGLIVEAAPGDDSDKP